MSISIGGIDVADSAINSEYRIGVLERVMDKLLQMAPPGSITASDMQKIHDEAMRDLQRKYPSAGIQTIKK